MTNIKTFREKNTFPLVCQAQHHSQTEFSISLLHPRHISPALFSLWISLGPLGAATRSAGVGVRTQQSLSPLLPSHSPAPAQVPRAHSPFGNTCCSLGTSSSAPALPSAFLTRSSPHRSCLSGLSALFEDPAAEGCRCSPVR